MRRWHINKVMRKCGWRQRVARENVERYAGGGMVRENVELQKLVMILVLYDVMVLSRC